MRTRKNTDILHMMIMGMMIVSIVLSLTGCPSDIPTTTVNAALYPFLDFTLDMATDEYVAKVIQGAKLTKLEIPGEILRNGKLVRVSVFGGYEDPADNATLKTLKLSPEIGEIAAGALNGASNLESVDFGQDSKLETIGKEAFRGTSLTRLDLPRQVMTIGDYAFADSKITDVTMSARTTATGNSGRHLFDNQTLENVTITGSGVDGDDTVGKLFNFTKHDIKVKRVRIGGGISTIDSGAFESNSSLESVDLSESEVTEIGNHAFNKTSIITLVVPEGVEEFYWNSVMNCTFLKTVTLPSSLKRTTQSIPSSVTGIDVTYRLYLTEDAPEPIATVTVSYDPAKGAAEQADVAVELAKHITTREGFELAGVKAIGGTNALSSVNADKDGFTGRIPVDLLKDSQALPSYYPHRLCLTWVDGNLEYTPIAAGYEVKLKSGARPSRVEILGNYKGLPVTKVADSAFRNCTTLTEAVLPSTIKEIGDHAFEGCKALASDIKDLIPSGVESVGESAFYGAGKVKGDPSLSSIKNLTKLGKEAFYGCEGLTGSVVLPSINIPEGAFNGCSGITQVTVPQGCHEIKKNAFLDCTALEEVVFKTKPNDGLTIGMGAFSGCGKLSTTNDGNVTVNGKLALPEGLVHIEDSAFHGGTYHAVSLPSTLTTCSGEHIFQPAGIAPKLDVTIPANLTKTTSTYNTATLFGASTTFGTVTVIPGKTDTAVGDMFQSKPLEKLVLKEGITEITQEAFIGTGLEDVTIPDSVTKLGKKCFDTSTLTTVTLPAHLTVDNTKYPFGVFYSSNVSEVTIRGTDKANGKTVGPMFYSFSKLEKVTVGAGIETIGELAFSDCTNLTTVTLPAGLETIGENAFFMCTSLSTINLPVGLKSIGVSAFTSCTSLTYDIANFLPSSVTTIGLSAFNDCSNITGTPNLSQVTDIGPAAFGECTGLSGIVELPAVETIPYGIFYRCTGITGIKLDEKTKTIGYNAFQDTGITQVDLTHVEYVGNRAFSGVPLDNPVTIPKGLKFDLVDNTFKSDTILDIKVDYSGSLSGMPWTSFKYTVGNGSQTLEDMLIQGEKLSQADRGNYKLQPADGSATKALSSITMATLLKDTYYRTGTILPI